MEQLTIFDELCDEFKITKPIRLIELFAGYGSQAMALERLGADFTHHKVIEFDKFEELEKMEKKRKEINSLS